MDVDIDFTTNIGVPEVDSLLPNFFVSHLRTRIDKRAWDHIWATIIANPVQQEKRIS